MGLDFVRLEYEISTDSPAPLTCALYAAARNIEAEFKKGCCLTDSASCSSCTLQEECAYWSVFSQSLSSDPDIVRIHQKPSLPFSFYIREEAATPLSGSVGIVIIGSAVNYVELFHTALLRTIADSLCALSAPAGFDIRSYSLDYLNIRHEIPQAALLAENVILLSGQHILHNTIQSDSAGIIFKSPLRLLNNGSILHYFDFQAFFCSQLRRCSSLWAYYGRTMLDLDYAALVQAARKVTVLDRGMRYTQPRWSKRLNKAGLTGCVECAALVEPMYSLLLLGSYVNAGKGAAFGSGYYHVEVR